MEAKQNSIYIILPIPKKSDDKEVVPSLYYKSKTKEGEKQRFFSVERVQSEITEKMSFDLFVFHASTKRPYISELILELQPQNIKISEFKFLISINERCVYYFSHQLVNITKELVQKNIIPNDHDSFCRLETVTMIKYLLEKEENKEKYYYFLNSLLKEINKFAGSLDFYLFIIYFALKLENYLNNPLMFVIMKINPIDLFNMKDIFDYSYEYPKGWLKYLEDYLVKFPFQLVDQKSSLNFDLFIICFFLKMDNNFFNKYIIDLQRDRRYNVVRFMYKNNVFFDNKIKESIPTLIEICNYPEEIAHILGMGKSILDFVFDYDSMYFKHMKQVLSQAGREIKVDFLLSKDASEPVKDFFKLFKYKIEKVDEYSGFTLENVMENYLARLDKTEQLDKICDIREEFENYYLGSSSNPEVEKFYKKYYPLTSHSFLRLGKEKLLDEKDKSTSAIKFFTNLDFEELSKFNDSVVISFFKLVIDELEEKYPYTNEVYITNLGKNIYEKTFSRNSKFSYFMTEVIKLSTSFKDILYCLIISMNLSDFATIEKNIIIEKIKEFNSQTKCEDIETIKNCLIKTVVFCYKKIQFDELIKLIKESLGGCQVLKLLFDLYNLKELQNSEYQDKINSCIKLMFQNFESHEIINYYSQMENNKTHLEMFFKYLDEKTITRGTLLSCNTSTISKIQIYLSFMEMYDSQANKENDKNTKSHLEYIFTTKYFIKSTNSIYNLVRRIRKYDFNLYQIQQYNQVVELIFQKDEFRLKLLRKELIVGLILIFSHVYFLRKIMMMNVSQVNKNLIKEEISKILASPIKEINSSKVLPKLYDGLYFDNILVHSSLFNNCYNFLLESLEVDSISNSKKEYIMLKKRIDSIAKGNLNEMFQPKNYNYLKGLMKGISHVDKLYNEIRLSKYYFGLLGTYFSEIIYNGNCLDKLEDMINSYGVFYHSGIKREELFNNFLFFSTEEQLLNFSSTFVTYFNNDNLINYINSFIFLIDTFDQKDTSDTKFYDTLKYLIENYSKEATEENNNYIVEALKKFDFPEKINIECLEIFTALKMYPNLIEFVIDKEEKDLLSLQELDDEVSINYMQSLFTVVNLIKEIKKLTINLNSKKAINPDLPKDCIFIHKLINFFKEESSKKKFKKVDQCIMKSGKKIEDIKVLFYSMSNIEQSKLKYYILNETKLRFITNIELLTCYCVMNNKSKIFYADFLDFKEQLIFDNYSGNFKNLVVNIVDILTIIRNLLAIGFYSDRFNFVYLVNEHKIMIENENDLIIPVDGFTQYYNEVYKEFKSRTIQLYKSNIFFTFLYGDIFIFLYRELRNAADKDNDNLVDWRKFGDNFVNFFKYLLSLKKVKFPNDFVLNIYSKETDEMLENLEFFLQCTIKKNNKEFTDIIANNVFVRDKANKFKGLYYIKTTKYKIDYLLIDIYISFTSNLPQSKNLLICNPNTKTNEIVAFLYRYIYCNYNALFCIIYPEYLDIEQSKQIINILTNIAANVNIKSCLLFVTTQESSDIILKIQELNAIFLKDSFFKDSSINLNLISSINPNSMNSTFMGNNFGYNNAYHSDCSKFFKNISVVYSKNSVGLGKSRYIQEKIENEYKKKYVYLPIGGEVTSNDIIERLISLNIDDNSTIHLDLFETKESDLIRNFLFLFLITKSYYKGYRFLYIDDTNFLIEIPFGFRNMLSEFPILQNFDVEKTFSIENLPKLRVNLHDDIKENKIQLICNYLKIYDKDSSKIDKNTIIYPNCPIGKKIKKKMEMTYLSEDECRNLISKYTRSINNPNYYQINTFINVLYSQLIYFINNEILSVDFIKKFKKNLHMRTLAFESFLNLSNIISIGAYNNLMKNQKISEEIKLDYNEIREYENSINELAQEKSKIYFNDIDYKNLIFFNNNGINLTIITNLDRKNPDYKILRQLLALQSDNPKEEKDLINYQKLDEISYIHEIREILNVSLSDEQISERIGDYVFTMDNLLKMLFILIRLRSNEPVIMMGETGCGKTYLFRMLANLSGNKHIIYNVHAGIKDEDIIQFMEKQVKVKANKLNKNEQLWVFFDEINTCNSMGLLSEIICKKTMFGKKLPDNICFISACNPYRILPKRFAYDGLTKITSNMNYVNNKDNLMNLVYRVNPLPHSLLNYVFDFGSLKEKDQENYLISMIKKMYSRYFSLKVGDQDYSNFAELYKRASEGVNFSQIFMKRISDISNVSLREGKKFILFYDWFLKYFKKKQIALSSKSGDKYKIKVNQGGSRYANDNCASTPTPDFSSESSQKSNPQIDKNYINNIHKKIIILSLYMNYYLRLISKKDKDEYIESLAYLVPGIDFKKVIAEEQDYLINQIDLPVGIASNSILKQNVFALFVCINTKVPIFICGKPGCSKSLSYQLIFNSMRGKLSENEFFKQYPMLFMQSYQGALTSTSEGILKIFKKARANIQIKKNNTEEESISLVYFDELGLADLAPENPLKVLNFELEYYDNKSNSPLQNLSSGNDKQTAFVGISNWCLDSSKLNRGIFISITDLGETDLINTALSIASSTGKRYDLLYKEFFINLSMTYYNYKIEVAKDKKFKEYSDFHCSRDFYHLIRCSVKKMIKYEKENNLPDDYILSINVLYALGYNSIEQNFGGVIELLNLFKSIYKKLFFKDSKLEEIENNLISSSSIKDNIKLSLSDKDNRYLMLITDSIMSYILIESILDELGKKYTFVLGSKFPLDVKDETHGIYTLKKLKNNINDDKILILSGMEPIYPSLYDLFNQNFTTIGNTKTARIAIGNSNNSQINVNDEFRCIVLMNKSTIAMQDPPFLNRFEKILISFDILLEDKLIALSKKIYQILNLLTVPFRGIAKKGKDDENTNTPGREKKPSNKSLNSNSNNLNQSMTFTKSTSCINKFSITEDDNLKLKIDLRSQLVYYNLSKIKCLIYLANRDMCQELKNDNSKKFEDYYLSEKYLDELQIKVMEKIVPTFPEDIISFMKLSKIYYEKKSLIQKLYSMYRDTYSYNLNNFLSKMNNRKCMLYTYSKLFDKFIINTKNTYFNTSFQNETTQELYISSSLKQDNIISFITNFFKSKTDNLCIFKFRPSETVHLNHLIYLIKSLEVKYEQSKKLKCFVFIVYLQRSFNTSTANRNLSNGSIESIDTDMLNSSEENINGIINNCFNYLPCHITYSEYFIDNLNGIEIELDQDIEQLEAGLIKILRNLNESQLSEIANTSISYINYSFIPYDYEDGINYYVKRLEEKIIKDEYYKNFLISKLVSNTEIKTKKVTEKLFYKNYINKNDIDFFSIFKKFQKKLYVYNFLNLLILTEINNLLPELNYNFGEKDSNIIDKLNFIFENCVKIFTFEKIKCSLNIRSNKVEKVLGMKIPSSKSFFSEIKGTTSQSIIEYFREEQNLRNYASTKEQFIEFENGLISDLKDSLNKLKKSNLYQIINKDEIKDCKEIQEMFIFDYFIYYLNYNWNCERNLKKLDNYQIVSDNELIDSTETYNPTPEGNDDKEKIHIDTNTQLGLAQISRQNYYRNKKETIVEELKNFLYYLVSLRISNFNELSLSDKFINIFIFCESHITYINLLLEIFIQGFMISQSFSIELIKEEIKFNKIKLNDEEEFYNKGIYEITEGLLSILIKNTITAFKSICLAQESRKLTNGVIQSLDNIENKIKIIENILWLNCDGFRDLQIYLKIIKTVDHCENIYNILNGFTKELLEEKTKIKVLKSLISKNGVRKSSSNSVHSDVPIEELTSENEVSEKINVALSNQLSILENNLKQDDNYYTLIIRFFIGKYINFKNVNYRKMLLKKILCNDRYILSSTSLISKYLFTNFKLLDYVNNELLTNANEVEEQDIENIFFDMKKNDYIDLFNQKCITNCYCEQMIIHLFNIKFYLLMKDNIEVNKCYELFINCFDISINYLIENEKKDNSENYNLIFKLYSISFIKVFIWFVMEYIFDQNNKISDYNINKVTSTIENYKNKNINLVNMISNYTLKLLRNKCQTYSNFAKYDIISHKISWVTDVTLPSKINLIKENVFIYPKENKEIIMSFLTRYISLHNQFEDLHKIDNNFTNVINYINQNKKVALLTLYDYLVNEIIAKFEEESDNEYPKKLYQWLKGGIFQHTFIKDDEGIKNVFKLLIPKKKEDEMYFETDIKILYIIKILLIFTLSPNKDSFFRRILNLSSNLLSTSMTSSTNNDLCNILRKSFIPGINSSRWKYYNEIKDMCSNYNINEESISPGIYVCKCGFPYKLKGYSNSYERFICNNCGSIIDGVDNSEGKQKNYRIFINEKHMNNASKYENRKYDNSNSYTLCQIQNEVAEDKNLQESSSLIKLKISDKVYEDLYCSNFENYHFISILLCRITIYSILYYADKLDLIKQSDLLEMKIPEKKYFLNVLNSSFNKLAKILNLYSVDNVFIFMNIIMKLLPNITDQIMEFSTVEIREFFENSIMSIVQTAINKYPKFKEKYNKFRFKYTDISTYSLIHEMIPLDVIEREKEKFPYYKYFLIETLPSKKDIKKRLLKEDMYLNKYPVLSNYLKMNYSNEVNELKNISLLNPFVNYLIDNFSYCIMRHDATSKYTITSFLENFIKSEEKSQVKDMVSKFIYGYNSFNNKNSNRNPKLKNKSTPNGDSNDNIFKNEESKFKPIELYSSLSYCINDKESNSKILYNIYSTLIEYQNNYFNSILNNSDISHIKGIKIRKKNYYLDEINNEIEIQNAKSSEVLTLEINDGIELINSFDELICLSSTKSCFAPINKKKIKKAKTTESSPLLYSSYNLIEYDLEYIEEMLTKIIFSCKKKFKTKQKIFIFAYEGDINSSTSLFSEYIAKYPQLELSNEQIKILNNKINQIKEQSNLHKIIFSLQKFMSYFVNCDCYTIDDNAVDLMKIIPNFMNIDTNCYDLFVDDSENKKFKINLFNIFSCYELIESKITEYLLDNVYDNFNQDIPNLQKKKIKNFLNNFEYKNVLEDVIRKFISRYLNFKEEFLDESSELFKKNLLDLLISKSDIWPAKFINAEVMIDNIKNNIGDIYLKNLKSFYGLVANCIKNENNNNEEELKEKKSEPVAEEEDKEKENEVEKEKMLENVNNLLNNKKEIKKRTGGKRRRE